MYLQSARHGKILRKFKDRSSIGKFQPLKPRYPNLRNLTKFIYRRSDTRSARVLHRKFDRGFTYSLNQEY